MELNPLHPDYYMANLAFIQFIAGDYGSALSTIDCVPQAMPELQGWRAATLAQLGRSEEAREACATFRKAIAEIWQGPDAMKTAPCWTGCSRSTPPRGRRTSKGSATVLSPPAWKPEDLAAPAEDHDSKLVLIGAHVLRAGELFGVFLPWIVGDRDDQLVGAFVVKRYLGCRRADVCVGIVDPRRDLGLKLLGGLIAAPEVKNETPDLCVVDVFTRNPRHGYVLSNRRHQQEMI